MLFTQSSRVCMPSFRLVAPFFFLAKVYRYAYDVPLMTLIIYIYIYIYIYIHGFVSLTSTVQA